MAAFNIGYQLCTVCPGSGGGDANNAGNVTVNSVSTITTNGDNSADIVAQSLGGGGGNGAITVGASVDKTGPSAQIMFGAGGGGGNGGDVNVSSVDNLLTNGSNSDGILAQSIGGGGGFGGLSATNGFISDIPGLTGLNLGQHGDQGGNEGDVSVSNASNIQTMRGDSAGIVAQSIGGGGGEGGWSIQGGFSLEQGTASSVLNYAFGSNGGAGGSAGNVSVTSTAERLQRSVQPPTVFSRRASVAAAATAASQSMARSRRVGQSALAWAAKAARRVMPARSKSSMQHRLRRRAISPAASSRRASAVAAVRVDSQSKVSARRD